MFHPPPPMGGPLLAPSVSERGNGTNGIAKSGTSDGSPHGESRGGGDKEKAALSEQEREALLKEEKEKWKILPPDPQHKTSKVRRLFADVSVEDKIQHNEVKELSCRDEPVKIIEGTLAAELMTLIENARAEGVGKPGRVAPRHTTGASINHKQQSSPTFSRNDSTRASLSMTRKPFQDVAEMSPGTSPVHAPNAVLDEVCVC